MVRRQRVRRRSGLTTSTHLPPVPRLRDRYVDRAAPPPFPGHWLDPAQKTFWRRAQKAVARLRAAADLAMLVTIAVLTLCSRRGCPPGSSSFCACGRCLSLSSPTRGRYSQKIVRCVAPPLCHTAPHTCMFAVVLRWTSSLVRVITTHTFLASDPAVIANHAVGLVSCTVLLWQWIHYNGNGPLRFATRTVRRTFGRSVGRLAPRFTSLTSRTLEKTLWRGRVPVESLRRANHRAISACSPAPRLCSASLLGTQYDVAQR